MFKISKHRLALGALLTLWPAWQAVGQEAPSPRISASARILAGIEAEVGRLAEEILDRNPAVAAASARARAADRRAPQVGGRPDPVIGVTAFLLPPETRTGPQRLSASFSQSLPGFGKLALKERAAILHAVALDAEVEAMRLELVTAAQRSHYELDFLASYREISEELRAHLLQHEEISRARYSTGIGLGQSVVKLQAEITRAEKQLLDIETRRVALEAELNSLRDRPASTVVPRPAPAEMEQVRFEPEPLIQAALRLRPEIRAADSRIAQASVMTELAGRQRRPGFRVGATYTVVEKRDDALGRLMPPEGNGDDIFGIQGGITLPIWRKRLEAGLDEAAQLQALALESKRGVEISIESTIGDLALRVPINWRQLRLVEDLLIVQAEESLQSAQSGYVAGTLNALDLLDAEHVLFQAQTALARARADYLISLAELEGAIGAPLLGVTAPRRTVAARRSLSHDPKPAIGPRHDAPGGSVLWVIGSFLFFYLLFFDPLGIHPFDGRLQRLLGYHVGSMPESTAESRQPSEREILFYRNPMDATITSPVPAQDEMGMEYLPVYADEASGAVSRGSGVDIDPSVIQNINVQTATVSRRDLKHPIRTVGYLEYDQQRMVTVTTKYTGWVEKVYVNYVGEPVRKGQPLFEIYSPELVQTEQELLSAIEYAGRFEAAAADARRRAGALVEAARTRLSYWDISPEQIAQLEETGEIFRTLTVVAPADGLVMKRMPGLEGKAVTPGMETYHIANLSSLWLSVEVFEDQLSWIREGTAGNVAFTYFPGEKFRGTVRYIEPEFSEKTRTLRAKLEVPNPGRRLRAGMFATVVFEPVAARNALTVPSLAVLRTGQRDVLVVAVGGGRFEPRTVTLGHEGEGYVAVLDGVEEGEQVVTSAQFLLDSEASLQAAIQKMIAKRQGALTEQPDGAMDPMSVEGGESREPEPEMDHSGHGGAPPPEAGHSSHGGGGDAQ